MTPSILPIPQQYTTATIEKEIPQLERSWTFATQTVADETKIFARTFSLPSFDPTEPYHLEKVQLPSYSEKYRGTEYYRVTSRFMEDKYTSAASLLNPEEDFLVWRHNKITYRMEKVYSVEEYKRVTWIRDSISVPQEPTESNPNPEDEVYYFTLTDPFYLADIDGGKALCAEVICDDPVEVYVFTLPEELEPVTGKFELFKRFIRVKLLSPTATSHQKVEVVFYGKLLWTQQIPLKNETAPSSLYYPISTPYSQRLLPPGVNGLPTDFWNTSTTVFPTLDNPQDRTSIPKFIEGTGDEQGAISV
jgi:hypothetical protein